MEVAAASVTLCLRGRKCLQRIPQVWFLLALGQAVRLVHPLRTQALLQAPPGGRAATLRLERWAPPTAEEAEAQVVAPQLQALAAAEAVSGQKVRAQALHLQTVLVAEVMVGLAPALVP